MANPTLVKSGKTFSSSGTSTLTLYNTQSENFSKSANLINISLPASNSSGTIIFDLLGVTREVRIRGRFTPTDGSLGNFTGDLSGLIDGQQGAGGQVGYTFNPTSISGSFTVFVNDVSWDFIAGDPNDLGYSLTLFEADSTASG